MSIMLRKYLTLKIKALLNFMRKSLVLFYTVLSKLQPQRKPALQTVQLNPNPSPIQKSPQIYNNVKRFLVLGFVSFLFSASTTYAQTVNGEIFNPKITKRVIDNSTILVQYEHNHQSVINPYFVKYEYKISLKDNSIIVPAKSLLQDLDMYFEEGIEMIAKNNDGLAYPKNLVTNQKLSSLNVEYDITKEEAPFLVYKLTITNRKVLGTESITTDNDNLEAYKIESLLNVEKILTDGTSISESEETIIDWFIPSLGIVKRQRNAQLRVNGEVISIQNQVNYN